MYAVKHEDNAEAENQYIATLDAYSSAVRAAKL